MKKHIDWKVIGCIIGLTIFASTLCYGAFTSVGQFGGFLVIMFSVMIIMFSAIQLKFQNHNGEEREE